LKIDALDVFFDVDLRLDRLSESVAQYLEVLSNFVPSLSPTVSPTLRELNLCFPVTDYWLEAGRDPYEGAGAEDLVVGILSLWPHLGRQRWFIMVQDDPRASGKIWRCVTNNPKPR
jgi:hypothetical protein